MASFLNYVKESWKTATVLDLAPSPVRALQIAHQTQLAAAVHEAMNVKTSGEDESYARKAGGPTKWGYTAGDAAGEPVSLDISLSSVFEQVRLMRRNPTAKWIMKVTTNHVIAGGVSFRVRAFTKDHGSDAKEQKEASDKARVLLERFWRDNELDKCLPRYVEQLYWFGSVLLPAFLALDRRDGGFAGDGAVRVSYVNPRRICKIVQDGDDATVIKTVGLRRTGEPLETDDYAVINRDLDRNSETYGRLVGGFGRERMGFYWRHNCAPDDPYGFPHLIEVADYLWQLDQHFFRLVERVSALLAFVWDVTMKGMTEQQIKQWMFEQKFFGKPPTPRAVLAHNENIAWNAVTPSLSQGDLQILGRQMALTVLGDSGIPIHWWGEGEQTNRAAAESMSRPTRKGFEALQDEVRCNVEDLLRFQLDMAALARAIPDLDYELHAVMPQVAAADTSADALAMKIFAQGLQVAVETGIIELAQAAPLYEYVIKQLGLEMPERGSEAEIKPETPYEDEEPEEKELPEETEEARGGADLIDQYAKFSAYADSFLRRRRDRLDARKKRLELKSDGRG